MANPLTDNLYAEQDGDVYLIKSGAKLGIGASAPQSLLEVRGVAAAAGIVTLSTAEPTVVDGDEIGRINFNAPQELSGTDAILVGASIHAEADSTFSASDNSTELVFSTGSSATAAEVARITSTGQLGINTAIPVTQFNVEGDAGAAGTMTLSTAELTVVDGDKLGQINFQAPLESSGTDAILVSAAIWAEADATFDASTNNTELVFATATSAAAAEVARITATGQLGINTAIPLTQFNVEGDEGSPGTMTLSCAGTSTVDGDELGRINFQAPLDASGTDAILVAAAIHAEADDTFSASVNNTDLVFSTGLSETATEKMRLTSGGRMGLGSTAVAAPSAILHVDQAASGGAVPVAKLDQGDADQPFIDFVGTAAADATASISTHGTAGATTDFIQVALNGSKAWIAVSTNDPSA